MHIYEKIVFDNYMCKRLNTIKLSPFIKWAGGKEQELKFIHPELPNSFNNYYEPFLGGGAMYFSINADKLFINDLSWELIDLYNSVRRKDHIFFLIIEELANSWISIEKIIEANKNNILEFYDDFRVVEVIGLKLSNWINQFFVNNNSLFNELIKDNLNFNPSILEIEIRKNLNSKINRMRNIEQSKGLLPDIDILDNFEAALKSALYMYIRYLYNNISKYNIQKSIATAIFFFIRSFAYSGMFRYNKSGGFNVPYGGIGYNRTDLRKKISYLKSKILSEHLTKSNIYNLDFEEFFKETNPTHDDFIFLDPPYDTEFSTYAQNAFTRDDQIRLAEYLINKCKANWMVVIKNTDFIYDLYNKVGINISSFNKKYLVSFQNRNDKNAEHLIIKNY